MPSGGQPDLTGSAPDEQEPTEELGMRQLGMCIRIMYKLRCSYVCLLRARLHQGIAPHGLTPWLSLCRARLC